MTLCFCFFFFFFQAEDGIRDGTVTGVQTCALPILIGWSANIASKSSHGWSRICHSKQWIEQGEEHDCWTTTEAALTQHLSEGSAGHLGAAARDRRLSWRAADLASAVCGSPKFQAGRRMATPKCNQPWNSTTRWAPLHA